MPKRTIPPHRAALIFALLLAPGCAALFGWNIHAPGVLSHGYYRKVGPVPGRVALYFEPSLLEYNPKDRGDALGDPKTFYVGEAYGPMLIEAFQQGFEEFVFMETEPTPEIMAHYAIDYLAAVRVKSFDNRTNLKGQAVTLVSEAGLYDRALKPLEVFEARGTSDAEKVFAKKGGPEVNLNAALENNAAALVQHMQDYLRSKKP